jgi:cellulose synthase/poly-beta-1,6-N-acetylglucosamine synthase-like glycosyltransferase
VPSISVCIATHQRRRCLEATLASLGRQARPPDEIVVSDASSPGSQDMSDAFARNHPGIRVAHVFSSRTELPWQRRWAFQNSRGEIVLFLDDDVTLDEEALAALERSYEAGAGGSAPVGVGFLLLDERGAPASRDLGSVREKWLGTSRLPSGKLTPGGLAVDLAGLSGDGLVEVDILSGGAMSFRREALEAVPELDHLVALYEHRVGRGEDAVLSHYAGRMGKLFVIGKPLATHSSRPQASTPYAADGWRLGVTNTWGRANTMRWLSMSWQAYRRDWLRLSSLEVARSLARALTHPWQGAAWKRLAGAIYGIARTLRRWSRIPLAPRDGLRPTIGLP